MTHRVSMTHHISITQSHRVSQLQGLSHTVASNAQFVVHCVKHTHMALSHTHLVAQLHTVHLNGTPYVSVENHVSQLNILFQSCTVCQLCTISLSPALSQSRTVILSQKLSLACSVSQTHTMSKSLHQSVAVSVLVALPSSWLPRFSERRYAPHGHTLYFSCTPCLSWVSCCTLHFTCTACLLWTIF